MSKQIELSKYGPNKGKYIAIVDDRDFRRVSKYTWHVVGSSSRNKTRYAQTTIRTGKSRQNIFMHHLILPPADGLITDHIDRNGLNNTRKNLRRVTHSENNLNRSVPRQYKKTKGTDYKGVYWNRAAKKWVCEICHDGKKDYLGLFVNALDAARAYNEAALKYHGEFAMLNVIPE